MTALPPPLSRCPSLSVRESTLRAPPVLASTNALNNGAPLDALRQSYLRLACAYSGGALLFLDPWRRPSFVVVALPARRYRAGRGISLLILAHSAQDVEQLR